MEQRAESVSPEPGQIWDYIERGGGRQQARNWANDPLRVTRAGHREGDWLAIRLLPREGEKMGFEWTLYREQIRDGRYGRRPDLEAKLAAKRKAAHGR